MACHVEIAVLGQIDDGPLVCGGLHHQLQSALTGEHIPAAQGSMSQACPWILSQLDLSSTTGAQDVMQPLLAWAEVWQHSLAV